jgi:hypothetical protein
MRLRMVIFATLAVFAGAAPALSQIPPEIPKSVVALASGQSFAATKRISLTVSSRRPENQATPEDLEDFRRRSLKTLPKTPFTLVPDKSTADFDLELIFEPYVRYGMFHYQNAPLSLSHPSRGEERTSGLLLLSAAGAPPQRLKDYASQAQIADPPADTLGGRLTSGLRCTSHATYVLLHPHVLAAKVRAC